MKKTFLTTLFAICAIFAFATEPHFRATWVSTVANIDFPKRADIGNNEAQQKHLIEMLDQFQAMNLNAIVFQVRPTADALYKSDLECDGKEIYGLEVSIWRNGKELEGATFISWPGSGVEPPLYEFYSALEILKKDKVARRWFMNRAWKFIFYDKPMSYYFFPGTYIIDQSKY